MHDYIEIVCLFRYPIKITMTDNSIIECIASDTLYNKDKQECIMVELEGVERLVVLEKISELEVCVDNPHFKTVSFNK